MSLYASATSCDISPRQPTALHGYPNVKRVSTGIHDPLLATVVHLRNRNSSVLLVALDLLMVQPSYARSLRAAVAEAAGCAEAAVFISCTHTHSAPVTAQLIGWLNDGATPPPDPAYLDFIKAQVVAAAVAAVRQAVPAELAWASADATGVGGNRLSDSGATDPECGVLALRRQQDQQILGMAVIYGMHPTVMHEDSTLVSSDFPHYTRVHIQEHLHQQFPIAYHTAPCGNQSPRRFVTGQTFAEAERLGRKLGSAVCRALDEQQLVWQCEVDLAAELATVQLPRNRIRPLAEAERLLAEYRAQYEQLQRNNAPRVEVRTAECAVFGAEGTLALAQVEASGDLDSRLREYCPAELQVLRIGDTCVVGLPGECFTEYALEIKRSIACRTFVVSLVNGEMQGYVVTPEAAAAGGYEATNSIFAPAAGAIYVKQSVAMSKSVCGL